MEQRQSPLALQKPVGFIHLAWPSTKETFEPSLCRFHQVPVEGTQPCASLPVASFSMEGPPSLSNRNMTEAASSQSPMDRPKGGVGPPAAQCTVFMAYPAFSPTSIALWKAPEVTLLLGQMKICVFLTYGINMLRHV